MAELHSELVKDMFHDFVEFFGPDRFTNVTNGITPRRWLVCLLALPGALGHSAPLGHAQLQCNPSLASLVTNKLGSDEWLKDLYKLKALTKYAKE